MNMSIILVFVLIRCPPNLHDHQVEAGSHFGPLELEGEAVVLREDGQEEIVAWYNDIMNSRQESVTIDSVFVHIGSDDPVNRQKICEAASDSGTFILDLTWCGNDDGKTISFDIGVPYVKIDVSISPFLDILDEYLDYRNSSDVAIIFEDPSYIDQALYHWINSARMRIMMTETFDVSTAKKLREIRPTPNNFALLATTQNMQRLVKMAIQENLLNLPERWNLIFLDFSYKSFDRSSMSDLPVNFFTVDTDICCQIQKTSSSCGCGDTFNLRKEFLRTSVDIVITSAMELLKSGEITDFGCHYNSSIPNHDSEKSFEEILRNTLKNRYNIYWEKSMLGMRISGTIEIGNKSTRDGMMIRYDTGSIHSWRNISIKPIKAFYRVGITYALPWSYKTIDQDTGATVWTGYCVDFTAKLAEMMNFDFEFVEPKSGTFGEKINGIWNGVVGDLVSGQTDLAITALIMTADKEEVIDFVAPYFEQTGITIVMRKPVRKTSLFKFMTVLKLEVWLSIVAALIVTGFMVWFLDKYSPYSSRNNKSAYPYPCREFTLKESFWFALTSFTPQGGGEAPKSLSGRTLVAAYWLFVVLMLATFTANLAAFLTVERMQAPVQSLEQLARQSRINYTVVMESETHQYFINMKNAEDTLYRMWKELTLNASTDDTRYRVWDYPIREQYGHILLAINDSNPVGTTEEGFKKVDEHLDADFAFIHDSSEIKYEISRNCNLTEVGEVFAEKPYAVAVQQGSHLQDDISKTILQLQKDRFFEGLQAKYWNHSSKGNCPTTDDNEGITLESLGGVFIATLFGLALAMLTLAGEVIYYKKKQKKGGFKTVNVKASSVRMKNSIRIQPITIGAAFKPAQLNQKVMIDREDLKLSHISLYPQARNRITHFEH